MFDRFVIGTARLIQRIEEVILAASIVCIAVLAIVNVFLRTFFSFSLAFAEELSQFLIIAVCFVGLSYAAAQGRHIRMTAIFDQLNRPSRKLLMLFITAATAILMATFCYYSAYYVFIVYRLGGRYPTLGVPFFVVYSLAPIGFFLATIQYCLAFVRNLETKEVYLSYTQIDEIGDESGLIDTDSVMASRKKHADQQHSPTDGEA